jgi:hypothetical protein
MWFLNSTFTCKKSHIQMKKFNILFIIVFLNFIEIDAQSISVNLSKPTDTLVFKMENLTEEISNSANFKLAQGNKFIFGQVTMKAHKINPFKLPKIFMNNKAMNVGINFPNLNQDAVFTFYNPADTGILNIKSPIGENAAELSFVFSKKDLVEGENEIKIAVKDNQNDLAITDLKLYLRAPLNSDNVIVQIPAEFPGGQKGWVNFLEENMDHEVPVRNGAPAGQYLVIVSFVIDKEGNITELKAENDPGFGTKEEALKIMKRSPRWIPASQNGKNVIYRHRQMVGFLVSEN